MQPKRILNLGCGRNPLKSNADEQYINVDMGVKGELIFNFDATKTPYPFPEKDFDTIYFFHTIEHIPEEQHAGILCEFRRLLKDGGRICLSYPEFKKVAQNYIDNKNDDRQFWKATIYGRGLTEWDRHKALMDTDEFSRFVLSCGLKVVATHPEPKQEFNTITILEKGTPTLTYESLMEEEFK